MLHLILALALAQPVRLVVSVAASMHDALVEIAEQYKTAAGITIDLNTGGSNTLARQIVEGAPADLFLSADDLQMDVAAKADRLVPGTRVHLVTNELVVIVPADSTRRLVSPVDLAGPAVARLAMGEPSSVPAGVYGRKWLERLNLWTMVSPKVVPFPTVLAALSAVDAGRVDAGIVYRTDAIARPQVKVAIAVPAAANPDVAVVYPAAVIRGAHEPAARAFLAYLQGPQARAVFARKGFGLP
ncbi:MAG: molybdate ABC transporter substrate-binding protein [Vicinamibacterales bacterium]